MSDPTDPTKPLLYLKDIALTRGEAEALLLIRHGGTWDPFLKILNYGKREAMEALIDDRTPPDKVTFHRGYLRALADLEGLIGNDLPERYTAAVREQSEATRMETPDAP